MVPVKCNFSIPEIKPAVCSKAVILLLLIRCRLLLPLQDSVIAVYFVTLCPFLFCNHLDGEERELAALLSLSSWCRVIVVWLFLSVSWVSLQIVIVILFLGVIHANSDGFGHICLV